jgi:hypothetical protein
VEAVITDKIRVIQVLVHKHALCMHHYVHKWKNLMQYVYIAKRIFVCM